MFATIAHVLLCNVYVVRAFALFLKLKLEETKALVGRNLMNDLRQTRYIQSLSHHSHPNIDKQASLELSPAPADRTASNGEPANFVVASSDEAFPRQKSVDDSIYGDEKVKSESEAGNFDGDEHESNE